MATTFSPALSDNISKVRWEIGDVGDGVGGFAEPDVAELQDETITAMLAQCSDAILYTAARCAWSLAAKYARMVDVDVDNQLTKASQRYKQYTDLAKRLDERAQSGETATPNVDAGFNGGPLVFGIGDCRGPLDGDYATGCCWPPCP